MTEQEAKDCANKLAEHVKETVMAKDDQIPGGHFVEATLLPYARIHHRGTDNEAKVMTDHGGHRRFNTVEEVDAFVAGMTSRDNKTQEY